MPRRVDIPAPQPQAIGLGDLGAEQADPIGWAPAAEQQARVPEYANTLYDPYSKPRNRWNQVSNFTVEKRLELLHIAYKSLATMERKSIHDVISAAKDLEMYVTAKDVNEQGKTVG